MQIFIELHYFYYDTKILRRGYFKVNHTKCRENREKYIVEVDQNWIAQILMGLPGMEIY